MSRNDEKPVSLGSAEAALANVENLQQAVGVTVENLQQTADAARATAEALKNAYLANKKTPVSPTSSLYGSYIPEPPQPPKPPVKPEPTVYAPPPPPEPKQQVYVPPPSAKAQVRDFCCFVAIIILVVLAPALFILGYSDSADDAWRNNFTVVPTDSCVLKAKNIYDDLPNHAWTVNGTEKDDMIGKVKSTLERVCVDKTNPATYMIEYCGLTNPESVIQYMGWGEILPTIGILMLLSYLGPRMKEYCFARNSVEEDKVKFFRLMNESGLTEGMVGAVLGEEPESPFSESILEDIKEDQEKHWSLGPMNPLTGDAEELLMKHFGSVISMGLLFFSFIFGINWGFGDAGIELTGENLNCWFMQLIALPFTIPLIIPFTKIVIAGYVKVLTSVKWDLINTTYYNLEQKVWYKFVKPRYEKDGKSRIAWWDMALLFWANRSKRKDESYCTGLRKGRFLPRFNLLLGLKLWGSKDKPGTTPEAILAGVQGYKVPAEPLLASEKEEEPTLDEKLEKIVLTALLKILGVIFMVYIIVTGAYTLPLVGIFALGAYTPTFLNIFVFATYSSLVLYVVVIIVENLAEAFVQTVKRQRLSIMTVHNYFVNRFVLTRSLFLLMPIVFLLAFLLTVPPLLIMGRFFFAPISDGTTAKYIEVTNELMNFNHFLWQWRRLLAFEFSFPTLSFDVDWDLNFNIDFPARLSFFLGVLATLVDLFADISLPIFVNIWKFIRFPTCFTGCLSEPQKLYNASQIKFLMKMKQKAEVAFAIGQIHAEGGVFETNRKDLSPLTGRVLVTKDDNGCRPENQGKTWAVVDLSWQQEEVVSMWKNSLNTKTCCS
jgi:hypothetical protein